MIAGYRRAARRCRTVNQFNALHIALDNRLTPAELVALVHQQGPWFRPRLQLRRALRLLPQRWRHAQPQHAPAALRDEWLRKLLRFYAMVRKPRPEPFARRKLSRHLRLYSSGGPRRDKTLLLCFVGSAQRPMMPLPVFLQHLDAASTDVLMVGYPRGVGLRRGLPELAGSFEASIDRLRELADIGAYRRCVALGTSGGGTPALLAALRLGLPAAMSAGGGGPNDMRWAAELGEDVGDLAERYARALPAAPRVVLAYGADEPNDVASAQAFAQRIPAQLVPVRDGRRSVPHNVLQPLLRRHRLRDFLQAHLLRTP